MRIETVTTEYKIYKYNELSDKAKKECQGMVSGKFS